MIDINKKIMETLKPIEAEGIPVRCLKYSGDKREYVTFFIYSERETEFEDNSSKVFESYVQVDVWSYGNYKKTVDKILKLMKENGFERRTSGMEMFEPDTQIFHKSLRFLFTDVKGD